MKTNWQPDTSDASQGSVLGPILFKIFVNSLGNRMECKVHGWSQIGVCGGDVEALLGCCSEGAQ